MAWSVLHLRESGGTLGADLIHGGRHCGGILRDNLLVKGNTYTKLEQIDAGLAC